MLHLLLNWLLSAACLVVVAQVVNGIVVRSFGTALIAAAVIGLVNSTVGFLLKILTLPLTLITLGLFLLVINALMLLLSAALVPGFQVRGFWAALIGSVVLSLLHLILRQLV